DRARDVLRRVPGRRELRRRLGDRRLPVPARDSGTRAEHPPLQEGGLVAAAAPAIELPSPRDTVAAKIVRGVARGPIHLLLVVLGGLWLVPTIGLFITSILPASA